MIHSRRSNVQQASSSAVTADQIPVSLDGSWASCVELFSRLCNHRSAGASSSIRQSLLKEQSSSKALCLLANGTLAYTRVETGDLGLHGSQPYKNLRPIASCSVEIVLQLPWSFRSTCIAASSHFLLLPLLKAPYPDVYACSGCLEHMVCQVVVYAFISHHRRLRPASACCA